MFKIIVPKATFKELEINEHFVKITAISYLKSHFIFKNNYSIFK
jgi:hypothetical protein